MTVKLRKVGNSKTLTVPKDIIMDPDLKLKCNTKC